MTGGRDPRGPGRSDSTGLLLLAIVAVSSSAVLVQWADASSLALAFWRTLGGAVIVATGARIIGADLTMDRTRWPAVLGAGMALALHFSAWLASLELTSVASSVTLVSTAPIWVVGLVWRDPTQRPDRPGLLLLGFAILGSIIIAGGDLAIGGDAAIGAALALLGAITMAVYLVLGRWVRLTTSTEAYAGRAYAVAAVCLLPVGRVADIELTGFSTTTWVVIGAMILGPQLAGHTVLNLLLRRLGPVSVSLALLTEPVCASILAWIFIGQVPPTAVWLGGPIVLGSLAVFLRRAEVVAAAQSGDGS